MKKTIWYGTLGNKTQFFSSQDALRQAGHLENTGSFTVDGEINGIKLDEPVQQVKEPPAQVAR
ncbi:MAG TPA: hypothetical protein VIY48_08630 [Candidatus Paceibacterota bacterium]